MRSAWKIWLAYGACLIMIVAAVGWLSFKALEADRAEALARRQATAEANAQLALWRIDSVLAPLMAQESAQPYFAYNTFYPADRLGGKTSRRAEEPDPLTPSPLVGQSSPQVLLHFQIDSSGRFTSPRVPPDNVRKRAVPKYLTAEQVEEAQRLLDRIKSLVDRPKLLAMLPAAEVGPLVRVDSAGVSPEASPAAVPSQQAAANDNEYSARSQFVNQNFAQNRANAPAAVDPVAGFPAAGDERSAMMTPLWLGDQLILARGVRTDGRELIQGCLLDWAQIERELLSAIGDLLPEARLSAVTTTTPGTIEQAHRSAVLPVRLELGGLADVGAEALSPVRLSLIVAWGSMLLGAVAVAALLQGVISLSERRGAFVSAVTHELRTPLTTFRMYAEMLAEGMVPDEASRRQYLETLRVEADRLAHLVENVLAYARLEHGRTGQRLGRVRVEQLLGPALDRLADRARAADFELVVEADDATRNTEVLADPAAVEQILFNLIDNACKYAAAATDRTLHLEARSGGGRLALRVGDHGPGVAPSRQSGLFRPFRKSARDAAHSAPGVGLGLALCRRLAREMGGDLHYDRQGSDGACFILELKSAGKSVS
jgi:signal transduction histidine kinase